MMQNSDPRHNARILALSSIFGWSFMSSNSEDTEQVALETLDIKDYDKELFELLMKGVKENIDTIDSIIADAAPEWPIDKIPKIDLIALRISVFELYIARNTPPKVAIDEAIELSKEFGNDTSQKFVNGVLGNIVKLYKIV
ncbi:MAG: transcription antitermination factor NusB [Patescibacteria group bacterium]